MAWSIVFEGGPFDGATRDFDDVPPPKEPRGHRLLVIHGPRPLIYRGTGEQRDGRWIYAFGRYMGETRRVKSSAAAPT